MVSMDSAPLKTRLLLVSLLICVLAGANVKGQEFISARDSERIGRLFDNSRTPNLLHCVIEVRKPALDFAFRFDVGYVITCSLARFGGRASEIFVYARVTPQGGKSILLGEDYRLPQANPESKSSQLKQDFQMSGGFAVGEGEYRVEVLVLDQDTGRTSEKRWLARVRQHSNRAADTAALPPGSILPIAVRPSPIKLDTSGKGLRVTVLLDAAPLSPRTPALRAWDRAFLLGSLTSLLKQIPCASVRLRVFNLEQQRELFRQDQFDEVGFAKLADSLRSVELGTISYHVLQQQQGWLDLLMGYTNSELVAEGPSDAVIILGPRTLLSAEIPRTKIKTRETPNPHFFYFEYFPGYFRGAPFADVLSSLTKRLDGTVYSIYSPDDLARCVAKMLARVHPSPLPPPSGRWPARPAPTP